MANHLIFEMKTKKQQNALFIEKLFLDRNADAHPVTIGFKGDPNARNQDWRGLPYIDGPSNHLEEVNNNFVTVSSFKRDAHGAVARRKAQFSKLHALMIDDLGDGLGSKIPISALKEMPSALIETSPGNFQAWYRLKDPISNPALAEAFQKAVVYQALGQHKDPGMLGLTRVGRLPYGINGKPKYGGWNVRPVSLDLDLSYTLEHLINVFDVELKSIERVKNNNHLPDIDEKKDPYLKRFKTLGIYVSEMKKEGWFDIECPWIDEHSDRNDTGTAYRIGGGFKCHHGHCQDRTIHSVNAWLAERGFDLNQIRTELLEAQAESIFGKKQ